MPPAPTVSAPSELSPGVVVHPTYALFSSGQVGTATLLGSPLAGAALIALNYRRLGETRNAWWSLLLGIVGTGLLVPIGLAIPDGMGTIVAVGSIIALKAIAKARQGAAYQRHLAAQGRRASTWVAIGIPLAMLALAACVVFAACSVSWLATDEVTIGKANVLYSDGATEAEARAVGAELTELGYLSADRDATVEVKRDHGRAVVGLIVKDEAFHNPNAQRALHQIAAPLSKSVFAGAPVDIWLDDKSLDVQVKLPWEARPAPVTQ